MKVAVRVIGRPYRGKSVGTVFNIGRGDARILVATNRVELVDEAAPAEAARVQKLTQTVAKTVAKRAAVATKAPARKATVKKAVTKTVRGTQNRSMAGKTDTKAD